MVLLGEILETHDVLFEAQPHGTSDAPVDYLWVIEAPGREIIDDIEALPYVVSITVLDELSDRTLVRVEWTDEFESVFSVLSDHGMTVLDAEAGPESWVVSVRVDDLETVQRFQETLSLDDVPSSLPSPESAGGCCVDLDTLSPEQRRLLEQALDVGYFDVPSTVTFSEIAAAADVSTAVASERFRRVLLVVIDECLSNPDATDDGRNPPE
ncbi:bacterio-opsin activator domain-containing protein [Haloarchaeobius sp. DFWS5]|uniref:helix-turn-helix domain-containing protein n=1 Tax=Haloarchaeobius sp. DFWS5 TaxID=3446114 RepID=UPI003EBF9266